MSFFRGVRRNSLTPSSTRFLLPALFVEQNLLKAYFAQNVHGSCREYGLLVYMLPKLSTLARISAPPPPPPRRLQWVFWLITQSPF